MRGFLLALMLIMTTNGKRLGSGRSNQEPRCNTRVDNDFKFMEKLAKLEERQETLQETINSQKNLIRELQDELRVSLLPYWGDWSAWSDCYFNCTGSNGGRVQSRSRESIGHSSKQKPQKETEERPCNVVQFAGCVKSFGTDDNFGVTYDFADQIAVSTCTALLQGGNYVFAVRRQCSNHAVSCADTCKNVGATCFNALHVYRGSPILQRNQNGAKGLYVYRYNGCSGSFCGPNFCCCHG